MDGETMANMSIHDLAKEIHQNAIDHGWWEIMGEAPMPYMIAERVAAQEMPATTVHPAPANMVALSLREHLAALCKSPSVVFRESVGMPITEAMGKGAGK